MKSRFDLENMRNNFNKYQNTKSILVRDYCPDLKPQVSIMIPTFKRPHLIRESIDSAFNQESDIIFEVVIVDNDNNNEFSKEIESIIEDYRDKNIRYFRNENNIGMFGNWNRCIELARSEYLTILNDDDLLCSDWMEYITRDIESTTLIGCRVKKFSELYEINSMVGKDIYGAGFKKWSINDLFIGMWTNGTLGTLLNREACIELGGFNDELYPMADWYFMVQYTNKFGSRVSNKELAFFRWAENESLNLSVVRSQIESNFEFRSYLKEAGYVKGIGWLVLSKMIRTKSMKLADKEYSDYNLKIELSGLNMNECYFKLISNLPLNKFISVYYFVRYFFCR